MNEDYTYILERLDAKSQRRFYVGRTNDIARRLVEHSRDRYSSYKLIWYFYGNLEAKIKKFGATMFVECLKEGIWHDNER